MVAAMVKDDIVMGLCGETKIANKNASWVSMIQVFEYYISHHLTKAFESVFGGVTCLPGCFSMYRISPHITSLTQELKPRKVKPGILCPFWRIRILCRGIKRIKLIRCIKRICSCWERIGIYRL